MINFLNKAKNYLLKNFSSYFKSQPILFSSLPQSLIKISTNFTESRCCHLFTREVTRLLKRIHLTQEDDEVVPRPDTDSDVHLIQKKQKRSTKSKKSKRLYFYRSIPDPNTSNYQAWPDDIKEYFTRIYSYKKPDNNDDNDDGTWSLPSSEHLYKSFYQYPLLKRWSRELHDVKSQLSEYPMLNWSSHTNKTEPCKEIARTLKNCEGYDVVTISWIKLQEILYTYPELCPSSGCFNSLHLCEAPGSFIASLNHYLHNNYPKEQIQWDWLATTLNQYYEENDMKFLVNDDRFIQHTFDHWIFGEDETGNLINLKNIDHIKRKCEERFNVKGVHLITADGSFDCSVLETSQEEAVGTLNFSEILTALSILNDGGCFVLKMFTAFESYTVNFIYLLNCVFERVEVFKPITSRRGNSEVYYICIKFKKKNTGNLTGVLEAMRSRFRNDNNLMLWPIFSNVPESFRQQHQNCCRYFMDKQIASIQHNVLLYDKKKSENSWRNGNLQNGYGSDNWNSWDIFKKVFFMKYTIMPLDSKDLLMPTYKRTPIKSDKSPIVFKCMPSIDIDRKSPEFLKYIYELRQFIAHLEKTRNQRTTSNDNYWWKFNLVNGLTQNISIDDSVKNYPLELLDIVHGKPLEACRNSMFVYQSYMILVSRFTPLEKDPLWFSDPRAIISNDNVEIHYNQQNNDKGNSFAQKQGIFFTKLLHSLLQIVVEENVMPESKLIFVNLPFLTHYSVSFLHYLARFVYKELEISNNETLFEIHLIGLRPFYRNALETLKSILMIKVGDENDYLNQSDITLHRWIKLTELHDDILCYPLIFYNNNLLQYNFLKILEQ